MVNVFAHPISRLVSNVSKFPGDLLIAWYLTVSYYNPPFHDIATPLFYLNGGTKSHRGRISIQYSAPITRQFKVGMSIQIALSTCIIGPLLWVNSSYRGHFHFRLTISCLNISKFSSQYISFHFISQHFSQFFTFIYKHAFHPKIRKNGKKWGCEYSPRVIKAFNKR